MVAFLASARTSPDEEGAPRPKGGTGTLHHLAGAVNRKRRANLCYPLRDSAEKREAPRDPRRKDMIAQPPAPPKKSRLDTAANIAIILVCAIAAVVLVRREFFPAAPPPPPGAVEKGERFDQLKAVLPAGAQKTLVVAVSPTCHFCNESLPFYKRLVDERNQKSSPVKFLAAVRSEGEKSEEAKKFADAGVRLDGVVPIDFSSIKVPGTPTLLLVDNNGKVLNVWVGKLDDSGQKDVLEVL
jgi:thioredoxin-related protein